MKRLLLSRDSSSRGGNGEVIWQLQSAVSPRRDGGEEEEGSYLPEPVLMGCCEYSHLLHVQWELMFNYFVLSRPLTDSFVNSHQLP